MCFHGAHDDISYLLHESLQLHQLDECAAIEDHEDPFEIDDEVTITSL